MNTFYTFIDAANLKSAQSIKGRFVDYCKLKEYIEQQYNPAKLKIFYYDAYPAEGTRPYSLIYKQKFYTFLKKKLGFKVRSKPLKRINKGSRVYEKGNMDGDMIVDIMEYAPFYDNVILLTGDSDFYSAMRFLMTQGKKVFVIAAESNISKELRIGATSYTNILKIPVIWGKKFNRRFKA